MPQGGQECSQKFWDISRDFAHEKFSAEFSKFFGVVSRFLAEIKKVLRRWVSGRFAEILRISSSSFFFALCRISMKLLQYLKKLKFQLKRQSRTKSINSFFLRRFEYFSERFCLVRIRSCYNRKKPFCFETLIKTLRLHNFVLTRKLMKMEWLRFFF